MVRLPLVIVKVWPWERSPVTLKVIVPEAVPFELEVPNVRYSPDVLEKVIVCPTERFTSLWPCPNGPPC